MEIKRKKIRVNKPYYLIHNFTHPSPKPYHNNYNYRPSSKPLFKKQSKTSRSTPIVRLSEDQFKLLLGVKPINKWNKVKRGEISNILPDNFDAREQWPSCIHPIRNQFVCNSCWAFGAAEVLSDRYCIKHLNSLVFSPQDIISCTNHGCEPATINLGWDYMNKYGVAIDSCIPYISGNNLLEKCRSLCVDNSTKNIFYSENIIRPTTIENIKKEIITYGPVETGLKIYEDFKRYKSGIYYKTKNPGQYLGGHAVKLIGWGINEDGIEYWIAANSWGTSWGENGYFKVKMGELGIESQVIAGYAK